MKQAVVFFSRDGSTHVFAKAIADKFEAQLFELKEVTPIKGFLAAAWSAMSGKKSELINNFASEMDVFNKIFVGTPVWGGKATPAVNMFFENAQIKGKEIVFFTVQGGKTDGSPIGGAMRMLKDLAAKGTEKSSSVSFTGVGKKEAMSEQAAKQQIEVRM